MLKVAYQKFYDNICAAISITIYDEVQFKTILKPLKKNLRGKILPVM